MSGVDYLPLTINDLFPDQMSKAEKAGHSHTTARIVHEQALKISMAGTMSYEVAELEILRLMGNPVPTENAVILIDDGYAGRIAYNKKLDKYSQPLRPGPDLARERKNAGVIMKAKDRNKSSKGKHPSNYTPPKKKRK
jgi:hypothetical protein